MNIVSDPKSIPPGTVLSPEANQAAALATATGVLTVDLDAIVANWRKLEKTAVPAECAGVIKADAYGCGVDPVARALAGAGCKTFFVATLDEARAARAALPSAAIYVLDGFFQNSGDAYAKIDAKPVIGDLNELAEWDVFCRRSGWAGGAAIHIDTGMNRLGLTITEAQGIVPRINAGDHGITLVMSHLACAESLNHPLNAKQLATFREIASLFSGVPASLSNSSGIFLGRAIPVRPGAAGCCALRRQSDAGGRQSDAAGGRAEGPHRADPQCRARRKRRLWRHLDRAAADQAGDRLRRLCRRLFPRRRQQRRHPRRRGDGRRQALPGRRPHLDGPDGRSTSPISTRTPRGAATW